MMTEIEMRTEMPNFGTRIPNFDEMTNYNKCNQRRYS